jgi:hypothetical protein
MMTTEQFAKKLQDKLDEYAENGMLNSIHGEGKRAEGYLMGFIDCIDDAVKLYEQAASLDSDYNDTSDDEELLPPLKAGDYAVLTADELNSGIPIGAKVKISRISSDYQYANILSFSTASFPEEVINAHGLSVYVSELRRFKPES